MDKILEFKCTIDRCVYSSDDFKIYGVLVDSLEYPDVKITKYGTATIKGNIQELNLGVEYLVKSLEVADNNGIGYKAINIKREKPTTLSAQRNFLYEILTVNQANTLLSVYPDIVDRIIKDKLNDIDLSKIKGIKEYTFNVIKNKVIENFKLADLVEEFQGLFSISILKKLYEKYPSIEKVREVIRDKPYDCLCGLSRIGFKTADELLLRIDKESKKNIKQGKKPILFFNFDLKTSYQRMKACVDYILDENENNGNTFINIKELKNECEILTKDAIHHFPSIIKSEDNNIYFDINTLRVCKLDTYETEKYIAEKILKGLKINTQWNCDYKKYNKLDNFELTENQCKTSEYICKYNIVILNGFGGSGKSSSTKALINMLRDYNKSFMLLAPTGRASKVLSSYTNSHASTIHRGLGYMPPLSWFYNENNPLPYDVVIVDESSMIDVFLFKKLLEAIDFARTKLLIIGDDAQIPSVGAGNVLYDLLHCNLIPTVTLDKIFRYGEGGLMTVATDIRMQKEYLDKNKKGLQVFGKDKSYAFMPVTQDRIVDYTVSVYKKILSQGYKLDDIAVLSCYNKGEYGTVKINKSTQNAINKNPESYIKFGETEFRINDIVININNDYKAIKYNQEFINEDDTTFIANGEIGKIIKIEKSAIVIDYDNVLIYCKKNNLSNIRLAYSISTHKSQGGQFKVVILVTPKAHTYMLNSNLLYVGVSRATEKCFHLGDIKTINTALKKKENFDRNTMLGAFLKIV